jgi:hypothetical protein
MTRGVASVYLSRYTAILDGGIFDALPCLAEGLVCGQSSERYLAATLAHHNVSACRFPPSAFLSCCGAAARSRCYKTGCSHIKIGASSVGGGDAGDTASGSASGGTTAGGSSTAQLSGKYPSEMDAAVLHVAAAASAAQEPAAAAACAACWAFNLSAIAPGTAAWLGSVSHDGSMTALPSGRLGASLVLHAAPLPYAGTFSNALFRHQTVGLFYRLSDATRAALAHSHPYYPALQRLRARARTGKAAADLWTLLTENRSAALAEWEGLQQGSGSAFGAERGPRSERGLRHGHAGDAPPTAARSSRAGAKMPHGHNALRGTTHVHAAGEAAGPALAEIGRHR